MPRNLFKLFIMLIIAVFVSGCGVKAQRYVQVRERTDQQMQGNAGYVGGEPKPEDRSAIRKTRKVYVLEFLKEEGGSNQEEVASPPPSPSSPPPSRNRYNRRTSPPKAQIIPTFDEPQAITEYQMHTVQKNETLQKISKQYYGGYSQWPKIYEANKDVLKDPNKLKPGITLKVPFE